MAIATETIVLRVEAQTDGAIRATDKLTAAQQKLADGFRAAVAGGDDMMSKLGDGIKALPGTVGKLGDALKSIGFDAQTFSKGLKDIGKGLTFDLIRTGLKSLNGEINSTAKSTLSAAVNGAAMGAAFGGPLGAAIGGVVGGLKGLVGGLMDSESELKKHREEVAKQAKAYWDAIAAAERKKRAEEEIAPALAEVARHEKEISERADIANGIMNASVDAYRKATDGALAYSEKLYKINYEIRERLKLEGKLAGEGISNGANVGGIQEGDAAEAIKASRGLRDAQTEAYAATKSYGETLLEVSKAEISRADKMHDLEQIMGDVNVSQNIQKQALKEYNVLFKEQNKETDDAIKKAQELAKANLAAWKPALDALKRENSYSDPWASARGEEARATALANYDASVQEKVKALNEPQGPSLENDMRSFDWADQLKTEKLNKAKSRLEDIFGPADDFNTYRELFKGLGDAVGGAYDAVVSGQGSASAAFRKITADALMATGKRATVEALHELAMAAGSLATGNLGGAGAHAFAAAKYAAVAVAAGIGAHSLGAGGAGSAPAASSSSSNGGSTGGGSNGNQQPSTHTSIIVYGDNYAEDSPRMRQLRAERLVKQATGSSSVDHS